MLLRDTVKETTKKMILKNKEIVFSEKKCKSCGKPYKIVSQVISILGKMVDKSYQEPDCDCLEIEEGRRAKKAQDQRVAANIRRLKDCGINLRFKDKTFSNFDKSKDPNAYTMCRDYAKSFKENKKEGLLLSGPAGTGKTHLAVAIIDYISRLKYRLIEKEIIFITVPDMVERIRKKMFIDPKAPDKDKDTYKDRLLECDLLVLDDLGTESKTEWTLNTIHQIIDFRYREQLPTVITTNLPLDEIRELYGERLLSRIYEMCQGIEFCGKDYRVRSI